MAPSKRNTYRTNAHAPYSYHESRPFSTWDNDNDSMRDGRNCAANHEWGRGGWWYGDCHQSNLNGIYITGGGTYSGSHGIEWSAWNGYGNSMVTVDILVRPVGI